MSNMELSFEQMREEIFSTILSSLKENSYSDIHTAVLSGYDPRQLILPRPNDSMLLSNYGTLSLVFNIPEHYPITLNIMLTMGRLSYSVQAREDICDKADLSANMDSLSNELGLRCDIRKVGKMTRFEFCNEPSLVWANTTLNILQSGQLEDAFKEFVVIQVERLIVAISNIIAAHGMTRKISGGFYALCYVRGMYDVSRIEGIISRYFKILSRDERESSLTLYGIESAETLFNAEHICDTVTEIMEKERINCTFRPVWQHGLCDNT